MLGSGSFGTAIAHTLAHDGARITLWARDPLVATEINSHRTNARYLPGIALAGFTATPDLEEALTGASVVVFAIPCQFLREFLTAAAPLVPSDALLVNLAKGIEMGQLKTPSRIFKDVFGEAVERRFAAISGPTFAVEICRDMPTGAVVASASGETAVTAQRLLSTKRFRLYRLGDVIGVELGGALKNVLAIEVGIADGLGFGHNTRAGAITRGLHEITEIGLALGANARTFSGLSGLGDLILTCTSDLSRNRQVGLRIGRGEKVASVLASLRHVAEGVPTAKSVYLLGRKLGIDMPNMDHVYRILYEDLSPEQAVSELLSRGLKAEYET